MKKRITREEVSKLLVLDNYFNKKHHVLKIGQTVIAVLGWLGVVLPFVWSSIPFVSPKFAGKHSFYTYLEEFQLLKLLVPFLALSFVFILIFYLCLTIWNNHRFRHLLQKEKLYNEERLEKRTQLLENAYTERFGPKEIRYKAKFYSVSEEQNFDKDFVKNLYKENGVEL